MFMGNVWESIKLVLQVIWFLYPDRFLWGFWRWFSVNTIFGRDRLGSGSLGVTLLSTLTDKPINPMMIQTLNDLTNPKTIMLFELTEKHA